MIKLKQQLYQRSSLWGRIHCLCLLSVLFCQPFAFQAQADVESGTPTLSLQAREVLRLPSHSSELSFSHLRLADNSMLVIPGDIEKLTVERLVLEPGARISLAPRSTVFQLITKQARFADGSAIVGRGSQGEVGVDGGQGANLDLRFEQLEIDNLTVDVRGGNGGAGWNGLQGLDGDNANCLGKQSVAGLDGHNGGDGAAGGNGGDISLRLREQSQLEVIDFIQLGGQGGAPGRGGLGGKGGESSSCMVFTMSGASGGTSGQNGAQGPQGRLGILRID